MSQYVLNDQMNQYMLNDCDLSDIFQADHHHSDSSDSGEFMKYADVQCPQWADEIWGDNWLRGKFFTGVYQMFHLFSACLLKPLSSSSKSVSNCFINFLLVY